MTKILLISDTHGWLDPKLTKHIKEADEVWHAGDVGHTDVILQLEKMKPTRGIHGNIDDHNIRAMWPKDNIFTVEGIKCCMTHIAGRPYKYYQHAKELLLKERPQIFICGHSHILLVQQDKKMNTLWLNPGACGYKGFHKIRTALRFKIHNGKISDMEAIELALRTKNIPK